MPPSSKSKYTDAPVSGAGETADLPLQAAFKIPNKIAMKGKPIPLQIIVTGGKAAESVTIYYRPLNEGEFTALPMALGFRNVYQASIPGSVVTENGLEYYIEVKGTDKQLFRVPKGLPSITVSVMKP